MKSFSVLITVMALMFVGGVQAGTPTCHSGSDVYCQYIGKVERIYVNKDNLILLYFDTPVALNIPESAGLSAVYDFAAAFAADENPEFAKMFYSTALAAQASGRDVTIQMRGLQGGYLKIDRIWLSTP
ncbi:hypothetical protein ACJJIP_08515 [Microbulbifer sp. VTAC004]|uniref:hypothetical protein n=1 Tax=Microbulbifer sp. VTAC004 TaxID=3243386 RepID=UPI004039B87C